MHRIVVLRRLRFGTYFAAFAGLLAGCSQGPKSVALHTGANALGCPESMVTIDSVSINSYHASGCSSGVDLVCLGSMTQLTCHSGKPHLIDLDHEAFCEDHENQDHGPDAPTPEAFAALPAKGALSEAVVRAEVHAYLGLIRACYECARWRDDGAAGLVSARFVVGVDGLVEGVTIEQDDFDDPKLEHCIEGVVYDYRFPPPEGKGPFMTTYPFRLGTDAGPDDTSGGADALAAPATQ